MCFPDERNRVVHNRRLPSEDPRCPGYCNVQKHSASSTADNFNEHFYTC